MKRGLAVSTAPAALSTDPEHKYGELTVVFQVFQIHLVERDLQVI